MSKKVFTILIIIIVLVNATGFFNEIFTADSALYATISKSFSLSGDYINIYVETRDWLDKPHFPFWICALFMDIFGVNTFAYKLPSLLFFCLGLFYTYKLAQRLYNTQTAYFATLILGSTLHLVISNNDTRAEAILIGLIMGGVYHLYLLTLKFSTRDVVLTSLFCAAAVMTKGIFVLIIIYAAIFGNLLFRNEFKKLFDFKWLIVFLLTMLFTAPELYAVYTQFDLHPEKVVFGTTNVSGVKFFFWDSQFGRFFNNGPIKGKGDPFFFLHTMLWACAPWAILGFIALFDSGKNLVKRISTKEYLTFWGFSIMFLVFSISKFQLPHYTNIIFPFLAILIAAFLTQETKNKVFEWVTKISINTYTIGFMGVIILLEYFFKTNYLAVSILILIAYLALIIYSNRSKKSYKYIVYGVLSTLLFILFLNFSFYPTLFKYQSGSQAAFYANEVYPDMDIVSTKKDWSLEFYTNNEFIRVFDVNTLKATDTKDKLIFADDDFLRQIDEHKIEYNIIKTFDHFHITILKPLFINQKTRDKAITKVHLITLL